MTKIHLIHNNIVFTVLAGNKIRKIEIKNGIFDNKKFTSAIITNNAIILEGDENIVLENSISAIYINPKSIIDQLSEILQNDSIYLSGINAIAEGEERAIIEKLIG